MAQGTARAAGLTDAELRATAVPVSVASVPSHAVTNAGTFPVQVDGDALASLQLIDDAIMTWGAAGAAGDKGMPALVQYRASRGLAGGVSDGEYTALQVNGAGDLRVDVSQTIPLPAAAALADATALPVTSIVGAAGFTYNGSTLDLKRGTVEGTALASAARTSSTTSSTFTNHNCRGVLLAVNITSNASAVVLRPYVEWLDPVSGNWITLTPLPTGFSAVGTYGVAFHPFASAAAGSVTPFVVQVAIGQLPRSWHVYVGHSAANSVTYSVGYCLLP